MSDFKTNLQTHKWHDVIPGYDQMSGRDKAKARADWYIRTWGDKIENIGSLNEYEVVAKINQWDINEAGKKHNAKIQKDLRESAKKQVAAEQEAQKRLEEIHRAYEERMKGIRAKEEENKKLANQVQAMYQRQSNALRQSQASFDADAETGGGKSAFAGSGGTLLTHQGYSTGQKLGGKSKLGGKTLLGV